MNVAGGAAAPDVDRWTGRYGPRIERFLKDYGSFTLAFSTVQPGLQHYVTKWGYLAYQRRGGITIAMGDPVADPARHEELVLSIAFIEQQLVWTR